MMSTLGELNLTDIERPPHAAVAGLNLGGLAYVCWLGDTSEGLSVVSTSAVPLPLVEPRRDVNKFLMIKWKHGEGIFVRETGWEGNGRAFAVPDTEAGRELVAALTKADADRRERAEAAYRLHATRAAEWLSRQTFSRIMDVVDIDVLYNIANVLKDQGALPEGEVPVLPVRRAGR